MEGSRSEVISARKERGPESLSRGLGFSEPASANRQHLSMNGKAHLGKLDEGWGLRKQGRKRATHSSYPSSATNPPNRHLLPSHLPAVLHTQHTAGSQQCSLRAESEWQPALGRPLSWGAESLEVRCSTPAAALEISP